MLKHPVVSWVEQRMYSIGVNVGGCTDLKVQGVTFFKEVRFFNAACLTARFY